MLENQPLLQNTILTITELFRADGEDDIVNILKSSEITSEPTGYDNWNGGTTFYSFYLSSSVEDFLKVQKRQKEIEDAIREKAELVLRPYDGIQIGAVFITPKSKPKIEWDKVADIFTKQELINEVNYLIDSMISVATGMQKIQDGNESYQRSYLAVSNALKRLDLPNPNPYTDLWQWYKRWSSGEMPQYKHRRAFIGEMYSELLKILQETDPPELLSVSVDLNGWGRVERAVKEIKVRIKTATTEEQFQVIGLLCRETIITLAQEIFRAEKHPTLDGVRASKTDAKRMLDAYFAVEISGGSNENIRKYARACSDLANDLTHKRTATSKDASLCAAATVGLVNLIGILENRH